MAANKIVDRGPAAETDLIDIWSAIASESPASADRFLERIAERVRQLSEFPESGPKRPDIAADARALSIGPYLILYRLGVDAIEIVRVVHGVRDLTALL